MRAFLVAALLLIPVAAFAQTGTVNPSTLSWDEPQANADGTDLTDLSGYRIEVATAAAGPFAAWGANVPATAANPTAGSRVTVPRSSRPALTDVCPAQPGSACQYFARVVAFDLVGNVGAPSTVVPFALRDQVPPGAASNGRADP